MCICICLFGPCIFCIYVFIVNLNLCNCIFAFANGLYFGSGHRLSTSGGKGSLISSVSAWGPLSDISARWSILHQALSVFLFLRKQPKRQVVKGDPWNRNETITMNNILVDTWQYHPTLSKLWHPPYQSLSCLRISVSAPYLFFSRGLCRTQSKF